MPGTHLFTLPEANIAPGNGWLENSFPFGIAYFQGQTASFRECIIFHQPRFPTEIFGGFPKPHLPFGGSKTVYVSFRECSFPHGGWEDFETASANASGVAAEMES